MGAGLLVDVTHFQELGTCSGEAQMHYSTPFHGQRCNNSLVQTHPPGYSRIQPDF